MLTGHLGREAFERVGADQVLTSVAELPVLLERLLDRLYEDDVQAAPA